jgi:hypothetical protein
MVAVEKRIRRTRRTYPIPSPIVGFLMRGDYHPVERDVKRDETGWNGYAAEWWAT